MSKATQLVSGRSRGRGLVWSCEMDPGLGWNWATPRAPSSSCQVYLPAGCAEKPPVAWRALWTEGKPHPPGDAGGSCPATALATAPRRHERCGAGYGVGCRVSFLPHRDLVRGPHVPATAGLWGDGGG